MGVDLGGGKVAVAKQHLHRAQIRPVVKEVGGEGVAQRMGGKWFGDPRLAGVLADPIPDRLAGQAAAPAGDEQPVGGPAVQQKGPGPIQVPRQPVQGLLPQGNHTLLTPLAGNQDIAGIPAHPCQSQPHQLGNPQPGGVDHLQQRAVPNPQRMAGIRGRQQLLYLGLGKDIGQPAVEPGRLHLPGGVLGDPLQVQQEPKESAQGGELAGQSAGLGPRPHPGRQKPEHLLPAGPGGRAAFPQPLPEPLQISPVGGQGVLGQPRLQPQSVQELIDQGIPGIRHRLASSGVRRWYRPAGSPRAPAATA